MKFIDSNYYCGLSATTIKHRGKYYYGKAYLHPTDEELGEESKYTGCRFAELRAIIKALKDDKKVAYNRYKECKRFVEEMREYKNFNEESINTDIMYHHLNNRKKELDRIVAEIEAVENGLAKAIAEQESHIQARHSKNLDKND